MPDTSGPARVVCKPDSAALIRASWKGKGPRRTRERNRALRLLTRCRYRDIQKAVDDADSGDRVLVEPGVYRELPSRAVPVADPRCAGDAYWESSGDNHQADGRVPTYLHQVDCPNSRNLIAIVGDSISDADRECDHRCHLSIEGLGRRARDVVVVGDRLKPDVIRADRADGFQLRNVTVEQGAYNDVDVVETNGFRLSKLVARWGSHYGILTFTSDNGLYENIEAYGSGDSGVYPGSGPERHCKDYGIEIRRVRSFGNTLGASGTAGNGTWTHDSDFHDNSAGIANDSFAPGHPGMPQDCSKWTRNRIHSNNVNLFTDDHLRSCNATRFEDRPKEVVCPVFQAVVGTGFMFYGVNQNTIAENWIYDQHRDGIRQFAVPAPVRGEHDPAKLYDTSHGNRYTGNVFGIRPDGTPDRNGLDVYWDEQGLRNCWQDNRTQPGVPVTSDPPSLPTCAAGGSSSMTGNSAKLAAELPCATWSPSDNSGPPGCTWFVTPPDPGATGPPTNRDPVQGPAAARMLRPVRLAAPVTPGDAASGPLVWEQAPREVTPGELPADRVLFGRLRNHSRETLRLQGWTARLRDDAGRVVPGVATFALGFTHGLYGPGLSPHEPMPEFQALRMGAIAVVQPGATVPLTVAWHVRDGTPSTAELGQATVALPASSAAS